LVVLHRSAEAKAGVRKLIELFGISVKIT
jgi:hypothetical protein